MKKILRKWITKLVTFGLLFVISCNNGEFVAFDPKPKEYNSELAPYAKITKTFTGSKTANEKLSIRPLFNEIETSIKLKKNILDNTKEVVHPNLEESIVFNQGTVGSERTELFNQEDFGILDALFVIDNSGSMENEQKKLSTKLDSFLSFVDNSDWKINLVSTDATVSLKDKIISKNDPNSDKAFSDAVKGFGIEGSGNERGLLRAHDAISSNTQNGIASWIRRGSTLAIVIVSDEDECSDRKGCQFFNENGVEIEGADLAKDNLLEKLTEIRPGGSAKIYGIVTKDENCNPKNGNQNGGNIIGETYLEAIDATNAIAGSICDISYDAVLEAISKNVRRDLKNQVILQNIPILSTVQIFVNNSPFEGDFRISGKTLTLLSNFPELNSEIKVNYRFGDITIKDEFSIDKKISDKFLNVFVNNQIIDPSEYTLVNFSSINFFDPPEENANIEVRYRPFGSLLSFSLNEKNIINNSIQLEVNNIKYANFEISSDLKKINLLEELEDNTIVLVTYKVDRGPINNYPFQLPPNNSYLIDAFYSDNPLEKIDTLVSGNEILFRNYRFEEGRIINILVKEDQGNNEDFSLPKPPVLGTENINIENTKNCTLENFEISSSKLRTNCLFEPDSLLTIEYDYFVTIEDIYDLNIKSYENVENISVTINNKPWSFFEYENGQVLLTKRAPLNSEVIIKLDISNQ